MIPVTKPFLPPQEEYQELVHHIWERNWLTNNGPLVNELELKLKAYLDVNHLLYVGNGTIALQLAIKALELRGEVITTPFSYVATSSSLVWEHCTPVFVDIDPQTLNIDPARIEQAITPDTSAILATHVYGNPCDVTAIAAIANRHSLKTIYDAAHAFGIRHQGRSIFEYGDISTTSFHATKLFHTIEGGAVFTKDPDLLRRMAFMRNFGHDGPEQYNGVGINGKNSEFHAAMGLCNLRYIQQIIDRRRELSLYYEERLKNLRITRPHLIDASSYNYAYFPVLFESEDALLKASETLRRKEIFARRYFYPLLSKLDYVQDRALPVAEDVARRVLCLPLYHKLSFEEIDMICRLLLRAQNY